MGNVLWGGNEIDCRSGMNEDDKITHAQKFFRDAAKPPKTPKDFKDLYLLEDLKEYPAWQQRMNYEKVDNEMGDQPMNSSGGSGSKRFRLINESATSSKRPIGRDKAKKMANAASSNSSHLQSISEGFDAFTEGYPQHFVQEDKRIEIARQKMERKAEATRGQNEAAMKAANAEFEKARSTKMGFLMKLHENFDKLSPQQLAMCDALQKELFG